MLSYRCCTMMSKSAFSAILVIIGIWQSQATTDTICIDVYEDQTARFFEQCFDSAKLLLLDDSKSLDMLDAFVDELPLEDSMVIQSEASSLSQLPIFINVKSKKNEGIGHLGHNRSHHHHHHGHQAHVNSSDTTTDIDIDLQDLSDLAQWAYHRQESQLTMLYSARQKRHWRKIRKWLKRDMKHFKRQLPGYLRKIRRGIKNIGDRIRKSIKKGHKEEAKENRKEKRVEKKNKKKVERAKEKAEKKVNKAESKAAKKWTKEHKKDFYHRYFTTLMEKGLLNPNYKNAIAELVTSNRVPTITVTFPDIDLGIDEVPMLFLLDSGLDSAEDSDKGVFAPLLEDVSLAAQFGAVSDQAQHSQKTERGLNSAPLYLQSQISIKEHIVVNTDAITSCPKARSDTNPTSVHALRPADIKAVAAMGDSLTAANGAAAKLLQDVTLEYRGISFSIGGDGDLSTSVTLPNILKEFNPDIIGFSLGVSTVNEGTSMLNVAVPGAKSADMYDQAVELVSRINNFEKDHLDPENDWKLITIFIGANDLCSSCTSPDSLDPGSYAKNLKKALDYLQSNLKKTFVNIASVVNVMNLQKLHGDRICYSLHSVECPCITNQYSGDWDAMLRRIGEYQNITHALVKTGYYDLRDDFTVVVQPFFEEAEVPTKTVNGSRVYDESYFAPDCFHFGQTLHACSAGFLWNSMIAAVADKPRPSNNISVDLHCPSEECPYLRTYKNSISCHVQPPIHQELLDKVVAPVSKSRPQLLATLVQDKRTASRGYGVGVAIGILTSIMFVILTAGGFIAYKRRNQVIVPTRERTPLLDKPM